LDPAPCGPFRQEHTGQAPFYQGQLNIHLVEDHAKGRHPASSLGNLKQVELHLEFGEFLN